MQIRIFGEIKGFPEGSTFISRKELSLAQLHRPTQAGISGSAKEGADSIVLSGGYSDIDKGDEIVYTGKGGRDERTGKIISNQELTEQNLALAISKDNGYPIRVIRGAGLTSEYAPLEGYRYDGLYIIEDYWTEKENNFTVYKFKLIKLPETIVPPKKDLPQLTEATTGEQASRKQFKTYRILRDTAKSLEVKKLYDYHCQVCNVRLEGPRGPYVEAAHIKPLGNPHNGPDDQDNIICLCPNHHVLFDKYAFTIDDDLQLINFEGRLMVNPAHKLNPEYLQYRRLHYNLNND